MSWTTPWPPAHLEQEAETLLTKGWAVYLLQEIGMVQRHLTTHRRRLEVLEQQLAKLLARAKDVTPDQTADLEREHEAIDPKLLEGLGKVSALLRPFMSPEERSIKLPAPWPPSTAGSTGAPCTYRSLPLLFISNDMGCQRK